MVPTLTGNTVWSGIHKTQTQQTEQAASGKWQRDYPFKKRRQRRAQLTGTRSNDELEAIALDTKIDFNNCEGSIFSTCSARTN